ncbi:putative gluconokinase [Tritrichomonas foetus]|uniref:Gluconokinase n=1 Tax=Tritrichomonas foetus TaxID=1144522 RepID=A0A1J4JN43_9EUKA|nr:putative gluconokinase [Tritrichomonas foetus]|eukprot:OHS98963.1 putative gluconokinase [Tritrichomonas foetus]
MTKPVIILAGPAGVGKTTLAEYISNKYSLFYIEGDQLHPPENIEKMGNGIPLTDEDRWGWLEQVRRVSIEKVTKDSQNEFQGVVSTCSALKKNYRDFLRKLDNNNYSEKVALWFIFLASSKETLQARMEARKGHYMKGNMVESQLQILEVPEEDEPNTIFLESCGTKKEMEEKISKIVDRILQ